MKMIDVGEKQRTSRVAVARAELRCSTQTLKLLNEGRLEKGDALAAARLAGIMAAKRTHDILPFCHPLVLAGADVEVACDESAGLVRIEARVHAVERTGVEMGALTAAMAAALTIYDMAKRSDRGVEIVTVRLVHKNGGRSGEWNREVEVVSKKSAPRSRRLRDSTFSESRPPGSAPTSPRRTRLW